MEDTNTQFEKVVQIRFFVSEEMKSWEPARGLEREGIFLLGAW